MKKQEERKLNMFRIFFQTVPILLAFGIIIAFEGYDLYFADFDLSLGYVGSFLVAILVCFVMQLFINRNPMLNNTKAGIVAGTILTIELLLFLLFAQYHLLITGVFVVATILFSSWLTEKIICINKEKRRITKRLKKWCINRSRSLLTYVLCIVLMLPAGIGFYEEYYKYSLSSEEWTAFVEWFNEDSEEVKKEEKVVIPHEDKIADLLKWDKLNVAEKERVIRSIALIEKEVLGISNDVEITVSTEKMSDYTCGYYIDSSKEIFINYKYLNEGELEDVLQTILHEMHHAFVHYTVENIDYESKLVQDNYYYKQAREWKENTVNYIFSSSNYDEYRNQPIEADARAYAEERAEYYLKYIDDNSSKN